MELKELTNLINIRDYVANIINSPTIDRLTVKEMNNTLLLLDKKIINIIKTPEFKDYINYDDVKQVIENVRTLTNIKSGIK